MPNRSPFRYLNRALKKARVWNGFPWMELSLGSRSWASNPVGSFPGQAANSFGSLARLLAAIVSVKRARTRSMPRYMV